MQHEQLAIEKQPLHLDAYSVGRKGITITSVQTRNGILLDPFTDNLVLDIYYDQSPDLLAMPGLALAGIWEIIEARTHQVVAYHRYESRNPLKMPSVVWWLSIGTAHNIGLQWGGGDIFGFRAIVEAYQNTGAGGLQTLDIFDVSEIYWFRFKNVFGL